MNNIYRKSIIKSWNKINWKISIKNIMQAQKQMVMQLTIVLINYSLNWNKINSNSADIKKYTRAERTLTNNENN